MRLVDDSADPADFRPVLGPGDQALTGGGAGGSTSRSNENWGDLALGIDLGPEPSLTEGLQSGKKKSRLSSSGISEVPEAATPSPVPRGNGPDAGEPGGARPLPQPGRTAWWSTSAPSRRCRLTPRRRPRPRHRALRPRLPRPSRRRWLIGVGALAFGAAVAGILFGSGLIGQAGSNGNGTTKASASPETRREGVDARAERPVEVGPGPAKTKTSDAAEVPPDEPIAVKTPDGVVMIEPNLKSAMQRAIGSKGHVLLNNRTPLKLTGSDAALTIGGGRLYIRAAEGVHPVLEVEMQGQKPFLSTTDGHTIDDRRRDDRGPVPR